MLGIPAVLLNFIGINRAPWTKSLRFGMYGLVLTTGWWRRADSHGRSLQRTALLSMQLYSVPTWKKRRRRRKKTGMMSVLAASEQQSHTKRSLCLSPPPLPQTGENKAPQAGAEMTRPQEHAGVAWGTMSSTVCAAQNNLLHKHQGREEIPRGAWRPRERLARGGWEAQRECQSSPRASAIPPPMAVPPSRSVPPQRECQSHLPMSVPPPLSVPSQRECQSSPHASAIPPPMSVPPPCSLPSGDHSTSPIQ